MTAMKMIASPGRNTVRLIVLGLIAVSLSTAPGLLTGQAQSQQQVTFTKDIAPILQRSCQNCHRPQGMAPMALLTYEQARPYARAMKQKTAARDMPPWFLEKNIGIQDFKDDPSLSNREIEKIATWADNGAPEGNPADMPPLRQFPPAGSWSLGKPDLVVRSRTYTVPAVSPDRYANLGSTPTGLTEDRWIKAVEVREFRPNEPRRSGSEGLSYFALHHAVLSSGPSGGGGTVSDEDDGQVADDADTPNTAGVRRTVAPRGGARGLSYTFENGQNAMIYPDDVGVRLVAGSNINFFNNHIHAVGKEVTIQIEVGIWLHPKEFQPKYPQGVSGIPSRIAELDIPGGADNVMVESTTVLTTPVKVVSFEPHLHAAGKRMCMDVIYPDGRDETLNCAGYKHTWVKTYNYAENTAPLLPAGTIVHTVGWYDNSAKNPRNIEPRNWHGNGRRSIDDMFINFSKVLKLSPEEFKAEVAAREAFLNSQAMENKTGRTAASTERPDKPAATSQK